MTERGRTRRQLPDLTATGAVWVFVRILGWAALAWLVVALAVHALEITSARALAALAAGIYYWFAAPELAEALSVPRPVGDLVRAAFLSLVVVWWWRAERRGDPARGRVRLASLR